MIKRRWYHGIGSIHQDLNQICLWAEDGLLDGRNYTSKGRLCRQENESGPVGQPVASTKRWYGFPGWSNCSHRGVFLLYFKVSIIAGILCVSLTMGQWMNQLCPHGTRGCPKDKYSALQRSRHLMTTAEKYEVFERFSVSKSRSEEHTSELQSPC